MAIDPLTIERIRDTAQILDVVQEFVSLHRRGQNYVGLCPFHNDRNPSFYVSPSKNICNCFVCHTGGDPIHFLMKHEQMSYIDAIRWLAKFYNIPIEEKKRTAEEIAQDQVREGMFNLNEFACNTFASQLYDTDEGKNIGLSYFYERGFQDSIIQKFHLGYALEGRQAFSTIALRNGHKREYLLSTGLCYGDEKDERLTDRFRGRVIFPVRSLSGKVVAFGGRVLLRTSHTAMKYVNSPESEIYHKSNVLYGIYEAKRAITQEKQCFLVEGYTDVLSMHQAGIENVIASSGTALTEGQIRIIKRFTNNITVLYDGDEAGIRASLRGIDMLLKEGMNVKVLLLPDGEDPDSFARAHTADELKAFIQENSTDFIRFKTNLLLKQASDPQQRAEVTQSVVRSIALIPDPILAEILTRESSFMLGMQEATLTRAIQAERTKIATEAHREQMRAQSREAARAHRESLQDASAPSQTEAYPPGEDRAQSTEQNRAVGGNNIAQNLEGAFPDASTATSTTPSHSSQYINTEDANAAFGANNHHSAPTTPLSSHHAPVQETRTPLITDRYERNIIRNIVRHGGETFIVKVKNEEGEEQPEEYRVVDYIYDALDIYEITFQHPLYKQMLEIAFENTADPDAPFDSIRFFTALEDDAISTEAQRMLSDRYSVLNITTEERLEVIIPRCVLELQNAIIGDEIKKLQKQLQTERDQAQQMQIIAQMQEKMKQRQLLESKLGERVITGR